MIEANENISLKVEQQLRDVEEGQAQAKAIAEGREIHPALLAQQQASHDQDEQSVTKTTAQTIQPEPASPPFRPRSHLPAHPPRNRNPNSHNSLFLWLRQRKR